MKGYEKARTILEFDKILEHIAGKCVSETGRIKILKCSPFTDSELLKKELDYVRDMRDIYQVEGGMPIWNYPDVRIFLNKCEPAESYLEAKDFMEILNFTELVADLIEFHKKLEEKYPLLRELLGRLDAHSRLHSQLKYTFEPSGRIFDNASPELKRIRKEMADLNSEIHIRLDRIMRKNKEYIQEEYLTLRDGRLVLPVREFSVSKVSGIVHGQSSTGATYFVEPMLVVELNNQVQKLYAEEKKEIIKILKRLSRMVQEDSSLFVSNFSLLNTLDSLQARARYANEVGAVEAQINDRFVWELSGAKHPQLLLMHPQATVPLNMEIGSKYRQLIITGPNAGGKTVALKTLGINQLLFQCGFHIPALEGTRMPVCKQIFAVIGDEQSIEQDLSTFSSHVQALNEILTNVTDQSLVLIDEIGSGTEPSGGAALAIAVLEELNRDGIVTLATTHLNQLKVFAAESDYIENAAMQFDREKLAPLFSLETGIPGSSFTFDICRRLGLDENILQRAQVLSGEDIFKLDALLADVAEKSRLYHQLKNDLIIKESQLDGLIKLYEERNKELDKTRKKAEKEALKDARERLTRINKEIEAAIREIKESQGDLKIIKRARERIEVEKTKVLAFSESPVPAGHLKISDIKPGMKVRSIQYDIKGTVNKIFKGKNEVEIQRDGMKMTLPVDGIELVDIQENQHSNSSKSTAESVYSGGSNIGYELDLRGLTTEEAVQTTAAYIDQALNSFWEEVRLIHGKGSGALRLGIHQYLSGRKDIAGFRLGKWGEGDSGVTVVKIK
ncbi:MAG: endonuclease MutS2 [Calditrichaceae bacterium]|nr:endonuclease MutS2 [Calditrichaceae bacterium]MBN2707564.1 endonuclease MutS2 [Calditrichaceae bacterium]RQV95649.1 MAG: endonuclease MutS2 [Calditrichota bacterium]